MKTVVPAAAAHLAQKVTTMATCWRVERQDGVIMGFTDYHDDLSIGGLVYRHTTGIGTTSAAEANSTLGVDNLDVICVLDSELITHDDVIAGFYNSADIYIFQCNYLMPEAWQIKVFRGRYGEFKTTDQSATSEIRSLTQQLKNTVGFIHESTCAHALGDDHCMVNLENFKIEGVITSLHSVNKTSTFAVSGVNPEEHYYAYGTLKFTSGENAGLWGKIKESYAGTITIFEDMPFDIAIGDTLNVYPGCDKLYSTCRNKFQNDKFRGFPHIPGQDWMMEYPNVKKT